VLKLPITARAAGCRFAKTAMPTIAPPEVLDTCSMTCHLQKQIVKSILPSGSFGDKGRKIVTVRVSNCVTNRYHQYPFVYNKKLIAQPLRQIQPTGRSEMRGRCAVVFIPYAEMDINRNPRMWIEDDRYLRKMKLMSR
jgi:hypothetical protein